MTTDDTTRAPSLPRIVRASDEVPCLTVLWHHDPTRVGERCVLSPFLSGNAVALSRSEGRFAQPRGGTARCLEHPSLSRRPLYLRPAPDGGLQLDPAGTSTVIRLTRERRSEPVTGSTHLSRQCLEHGAVLVLGFRVALLAHLTELDVPDATADDGMVGAGPAMTRVRRALRRVAGHDGPVLLRGETGTGKELAARAIVGASSRSNGPYVTVNLGAITSELAAAELFGSRRGAFTGAENRRGYFQQADGGTLFLDEVAAAPDGVQSALLRALDHGEVQPVGAKGRQRVNVRVIAATDADLEALVEEGRFRGPLLYRLTGHVVHVPPLRERRDDLGRLLVHFLGLELPEKERFRLRAPEDPDAPPWLSTTWIERLATWPWPGNVRELRAVSRRLAQAGAGRDEIPLSSDLEYLLADGPGGKPSEETREPEAPEEKVSASRETEPTTLTDALREAGWSVRAAARRLGLSPASVYRRIDADPDLHRASDLSLEQLESARRRHGGDRSKMAEELRVSDRALLFRFKELGLGLEGE